MASALDPSVETDSVLAGVEETTAVGLQSFPEAALKAALRESNSLTARSISA